MIYAIATYMRAASAAVATSRVVELALRLLFEIEGD